MVTFLEIYYYFNVINVIFEHVESFQIVFFPILVVSDFTVTLFHLSQ